MAECPFCKSEVHDEASICRSCGAEKVDSFGGHFNKAFKETQHGVAPLGFVGLLIGGLLGLSVGMNSNGVLGFIVFIIILLFFITLPALLRTLLFRRNKTIWYR
ncbi:hypothetical protein GKR51_04755 [Providencia sp. wls1948]|uniref:hypothetical protein n=1 Tax=Providencia sp. wls1948 TaxID=2675149 RepID=UPI0012B546C0|nr:hypothetical protein [Providencia sp. wls1948]MTC07455.1 hypothetical protein [Providencia sp. wls1948]